MPGAKKKAPAKKGAGKKKAPAKKAPFKKRGGNGTDDGGNRRSK